MKLSTGNGGDLLEVRRADPDARRERRLYPADMAKYIDHTYLKPEASVNDIRKICDEAKSTTPPACA